MANDGGFLLLNDDEKRELLAQEPDATPWLRPFMGAREFLNGGKRWCLWLQCLPPGTLKSLPLIKERVEKVKQHRLSSNREATRKLASTPTLFAEIRQPENPYLMVPKVSSERRQFIPIGFQQPELVASDLCFVIPSATLYHFGVISSTMHMAWVRTVCGRLESRYRYTAEIVYNNFPWPRDITQAQYNSIEQAAQQVLAERAVFPDSTLADLYDPLSMPPRLVKAHQMLDKAVDAAYKPSGGKKTWTSDAERVAFLFELYQKITSALPVSEKPKKNHQVPVQC